ncbi:hypothetical protein [Microcoleus sp.]|uniref:hypothetical protein n=1 Tax=Microcoleus sp. TaxID=44472 RepID=UPI003593A0E0
MSILKVSVLTASAFTLWLAPPFVLSRKIPLHNFTTGLALLGSFACCFEARRVALKLSEIEEFEAMKSAAIKGDVEDELATEIYVSEQQRRIEAEAILNSPGEAVEEARKALEALYDTNLQPRAITTTSEENASDLTIWWKVSAAEVEGKSPTWIIENILNMKGRKFAEGKARLAELKSKFSEG